MTVAQLIDCLKDFADDAEVFGDDGTRFVTVEKPDFKKHEVFIHTWNNIDHEEYLKSEVDATMSCCHNWNADTLIKVIKNKLMEYGIWDEMNRDERVFFNTYVKEMQEKEQKAIKIRELEGCKEHLEALIKECDKKIAELTKEYEDGN